MAAAASVKAWAVGTAYKPGDLATYDGVTYQALQSETAIATWAPSLTPALWKAVTSVSTTTTSTTPPATASTPVQSATAWTASFIYTAGMTATEAGLVYRANWWTQGNDPRTASGAAGSGQPWTLIGPVQPVTVVPNAPSALTVTASVTSAVLNWTPASVPGGGGAVTGYTVFENGTAIGTTTGSSFAVSGLKAATSYAFSVTAQDAAGNSAPSTPVSVMTQAVSSPPPTTGSAGKVFAPYVDMGLTADDDLVALARASGITTFTLAFIQSSGPGTIGWNGTGTLTSDTLANGSTIQAQIGALRSIGGSAIISFGGAAGTDPAAAAISATTLQAQYQSVLDRYGVTSLDFDIEGAEVADTRAMSLRDQALIGLKAANPGLEISFTLPVLPTGLDYNGVAVLQAAKRDGLTPDVVNIMAMDYGSGVDNGGQMGADAVAAAKATLTQLGTLGMTSKLGITPMIGVNDVNTEVFSLSDAALLEAFAAGNTSVERLSMWSLARDNGMSAGAHWAAPDSSGVAQSTYAFANMLNQFT